MASAKAKAAKQLAKTRTGRKAASRGSAFALRSPATRRAAAGAAKHRATDLADQARAQAREAGLDERAAELAERASELAERVRDSDAYAKAQAKGSELADRTRARLKEAELEERAAELAERVRRSDTAQQAVATAQRVSDQQLDRLGGWLSQGKTAEKLGVQPARRRFPVWLALLIGAGIGYLVGTLTAPKRGDELRHELLAQGSEFKDDLATTAGRIQQDTADMAAPPAQKPIADEIRTRLGEDPRTAGLPKLNVNVAEGTVFVRGSLPSGFDEGAIREVITSVPGVEDIDLQLTSA
ncbi:MAG: YtxH domain-containing protein [Egibacteraceae bacterium]